MLPPARIQTTTNRGAIDHACSTPPVCKADQTWDAEAQNDQTQQSKRTRISPFSQPGLQPTALQVIACVSTASRQVHLPTIRHQTPTNARLAMAMSCTCTIYTPAPSDLHMQSVSLIRLNCISKPSQVPCELTNPAPETISVRQHCLVTQ
jgi:hypothetical protein